MRAVSVPGYCRELDDTTSASDEDKRQTEKGERRNTKERRGGGGKAVRCVRLALPAYLKMTFEAFCFSLFALIISLGDWCKMDGAAEADEDDPAP